MIEFNVDEIIEKLIANELSQANAKNPPFHSNHEGYAVLLEEIEELVNECEWIEETNASLWKRVRNDDLKSYINEELMSIKHNAINAIKKAIQVAAMCDKFINLEEK